MAGQHSPATGLTRVWRQFMFNTRTRAEVWQLIADVLEGSGEDLGRMMEAVAEGYALQGRTTIAAVLMEIRAGLAEGRMAGRLAPYCGTGERILFDGLGRQAPGAIFGAAARLLRCQLAMRRAIGSAIALPIVLLFGFLGLLLFFGLSLLPALADVIDFDDLAPFHGWIVRVAQGFAANPAALAFWLGGALAGLLLLMRYWTGSGRTWADRIPPFSILRLSAGAGFLFAVVEYGRSGQAVTTDLLERMGRAAPPYARSRIRALARNYIPARGNLGEAGLLAGQGFPSLELSAVLRTLWNKPGGIGCIGEVLERWLVRIEETMRARMAVLNGVLLTLIAAALVALMSIALPIVEQINQGAGL